MREFTYILTDENGIHARPAGALVKEADKFSSDITLSKGEKSANAKRIFSIMGLAAKKGDELTVTVSGVDEDSAVVSIEKFLSDNL